MKPIRYIFFILLQVIGFFAIAQKQNIRFEHLGIEQGLSQSNVLCILQDSRGFMWFGTRDGLNKYDGYKFTVYKNDAANPNSLSNNFIMDIAESKNGNLLIATKSGLCRFDYHKNQFTSFKNDPKNNYSISSNLTTSVLDDSEGNIWVGTEDGLNMLDVKSNKFIRYIHNSNDSNSLSDVFVRNIFEDSQHNLWVCTYNGGLNLFNRKTQTFTSFQHNEKDRQSISNNNVYTIFEDSRHRLWIGTNGGGLNLFDRASGKFRSFKHDNNNSNSVAGNTVYSINEDNDNNIWIGTENGGLSIFNSKGNTFQTWQKDEAHQASLSNNSVYAIYKDTKSNMWLGTFNGGVNLVNPDGGKFAHYQHFLFKNSLSNNNVLCIYEDTKKNIWIGTDGGGLNLFDPITGRFTFFRHEKNNANSICGNYVLSVCEDSKGNIWVGTWGDGITVFNKEKNSYRHFKNDPHDPTSISSSNAWKILEDRDKNIWVGTFGGGLNLFNPVTNSFTNYQYNEKNAASLSNNNVYSLFEDSEKKLWVSTDGGGLNLFDRSTKTFSYFVHDEKSNSISSNSAGSICEDRNKNLWIGTGVGLSYLDKKANRFTNYTTADGLPNNVIFGILEDKNGNIWISTNKGISRFDPVKKAFKNFGVSDGLQSNEFKIQAFCKSSSGKMYFGGNNGFNEFIPEKVTDIPFEPPMVITGFQIFNKEVPVAGDSTSSPLKKDITVTKDITISYKSSVISFEFASLNYTSAEKKQYAYMLEGFDNAWNDVGAKRTATYTNLDPGPYLFKVKGLNNDGSWSSAITNIQLTITPPFWLTWWFKTIAILFILGCLIAFYRIRLKAITAQKASLERQVKERTAEIVLQKEELSKNVQELAVLQQELEQEKYLLDSLMDNMTDAIYFKDKESKFLRVSKFMAAKFGTTVNNLIGKSDFDFQDEAHAKTAYEDEQNIQKTGQPKIDYIEKEILQTGEERWVSSTKMPMVNSQGEVAGTFGVSRDITKVKELEKDRHTAELDKAVAQGKFEIASGVMHDIGNAVVGFGSYLTRIRRLQEEESPNNLKNLAGFFAERKSALVTAVGEDKASAVIKMLTGMAESQKNSQEEINKAITDQLNIIANIEDILNIQRQYINGQESKERKAVNISTIITDSLAMLFSPIDKMNIAVSLDIPDNIPLIKGDHTKLMQVILNVLKNSIEAIDINAAEKNISLNVYKESDKLLLEISDNGIGFDNSTAAQLFRKGYTTKASGAGLGLHNSRTIVESHEGSIDVTSRGEGKGTLTRIGFRIPSNPAAA